MSSIYRKSSIEKISSPEQLDRMVVITKPSFWIAIAGGAFIVLMALLWSLFGGIPEKVDATGVYVSDSGTCAVSSEVNGIVESLAVDSGQEVQKGDVLYTLNTRQLKTEAEKIETKLNQVQSVTLSSVDDPKIAETESMLSIKAQAKAAGVNTAAAAYDVAKKEVDKAKSNWKNKKSRAEKKKKAYDDAVAEYGKESEEANLAYTEYQAAAAESTTAESVYQSAKTSLSSYKTSKASSASGAKASKTAYEEQFEAAKGTAVSELQNQLEEYNKQIDDSQVKSPISGTVVGINIAEGSAVGEGSEALLIRRSGGTGTCVCYAGVADVRKIKSGMEVNIYPSNCDSQEYGHILGKVVSVDIASATETEIKEKTGDPALAQTVLSSGPVVSFTCELISDEETVSGYKWSTNKGSMIEVEESTFISAEVIAEKKKPITMLIPYLKDKFENMSESEDVNANYEESN